MKQSLWLTWRVSAVCPLLISLVPSSGRRGGLLTAGSWTDASNTRSGFLVTSALPLAEIAAACGFADQSHFTHVFSQIVGIGSGAWRRTWKE